MSDVPHESELLAEASAFLFDMDGTLIDSHACVEQVWGEVAAEHGLDRAAVLAFAHGRQTHVTLAHFLPGWDPEERAQLARDLDAAEVSRTDGIVAVPGAAELLAQLDQIGAPYALVTSAHDDLATARMAVAGVPMPAVTVFAGDVTHSKPNPEGYLRGAQLLGVAASQCVVFEDADAGIQAGLASGAAVVVVAATGSTTSAAEHLRRIPDFRGVTVSHVSDRFQLLAPVATA